jgi:hypothetical protein
MPRPHTPQNNKQYLYYELHEAQKHYTTPQKARIAGAIEFNHAMGFQGFNNKVFDYYGCSKASGYRILSGESSQTERRLGNEPEAYDPRGRPPILTRDDLRQMEDYLEHADVKQRAVTWQNLARQAGVRTDVSWRTIQRAMGALDYHKCIACDKGWVSQDVRRGRRIWSQEQKALRPKEQDWFDVRFSDEVHFGLGPQRKLRIIRRPGERYCYSCIQDRAEPQEKDKKKFHAWGDVGFDYKIDKLVLYDVPGNTNGKMSQRAYINQILEPHVLPQVEDAGRDRFILFEDNDSGHGPGRKNIVRTWKEDHGVNYLFNAPRSPDLNCIENCWQPVKQYVATANHWDEDDTINLIHEGWDRVKQSSINKWVKSMPNRIDACLDRDGRLTAN